MAMARITRASKIGVITIGTFGALGVLAHWSVLGVPTAYAEDAVSAVAGTNSPASQAQPPATSQAQAPDQSQSDQITTTSAADTPTAVTDTESNDEDDIGDVAGRITATYFGLFYGPSVSKPTGYQPTQDGIQDPDRPVMLKNFAGLGYNITDHVRISPTAHWDWLPTGGGAYSVQDPFVKLSDDAIVSAGGFNLYGDIRYHAPISNFSKAVDITGSYQSVQVATYVPPGSRWTLGLWGSERAYTYGPKGYGNDFELYIAPNVGYQLTPKMQLTLLYETNLDHEYGMNPGTMEGDGTDLQPGLSIDLTNYINVHPYLSIYPSAPSISSTSVGALVYWQAF